MAPHITTEWPMNANKVFKQPKNLVIWFSLDPDSQLQHMPDALNEHIHEVLPWRQQIPENTERTLKSLHPCPTLPASKKIATLHKQVQHIEQVQNTKRTIHIFIVPLSM